MTERLVFSIAEAAESLGVSDDLVYHLVARGELPCLRFGRRKVIPRIAVEKVIELAMDGFDPSLVLRRVSEHAREELGNLSVPPDLEVRVDRQRRLPSPAVADAAGDLRQLNSRPKKRRHDEVAKAVQMDLLADASALPERSEPSAG